MSFHWPAALVGLALIPLLIVAYLWAQRRRRAYVLRFTNLALLKQVATRHPGWRRHLPAALLLMGLVALLISLARPVAILALPRHQTTIMLVIDVSGSMEATDLQPTRMEAAKAAARAFVSAAPQHTRIGLVSFSTGATLMSPPTDDHALIMRMIDQLTAFGGTAMGDGLALAIQQLHPNTAASDTEQAPGVVVLLSDGTPTLGLPPQQVAEQARQAGIVVHTVGIGQRDAQVFVRGIPVQLDEAILQQIAETTGGQYFYAADRTALTQIYERLGASVAMVREEIEITALFSALGTLLTLAAALTSLFWFRQVP